MPRAEPGDTSASHFGGPRRFAALLTHFTIGLTALAAISGCQQHKPPPPPAVTIPAPPPPAPPARQPVVRRASHLAWSFEATPDKCVATASGEGATLTITVQRNVGVVLRLALAAPLTTQIRARTTATLRFRGPSGNWALHGRGDPHVGISIASASDEVSLGRVLMLLAGGILDVDLRAPGPPSLQIPPAGPEGTSWFDCARAQMI
jgi:hypothetical protein